MAKKTGEITGAQQVLGVFSVGYGTTGDLGRPATALTYDEYREMRKHPTIALGRAFFVALVTMGQWTYECDDGVDDEVVKLVQGALDKLRRRFVKQAVQNNIDYGWCGWEIVWGEVDGAVVPLRLKHLLPDITTILTTTSGEFSGFRNVGPDRSQVTLELDRSLLVTINMEGDQHYGESLLDNVASTKEAWDDANAGAARYDRKVAGTRTVVYYPPGTSMYGGVETDNYEIAKALLQTIEAAGSVTVPADVQEYVDDKADNGWKIEVLDKGAGQQPGFTDRLRYLDALMYRGLIIPERAVMEGQFGTKAEAGEHAGLLITFCQSVDRDVADVVNERVVNQLLSMNYGPDMIGKVRIVPAPLVDARQSFLQQLYLAVVGGMTGGNELALVDTDALKDALGVPKSEEVAAQPDAQEPAIEAAIGDVARTEVGRWTRDGVGVAARFGPGHEDIDATFAEAAEHASARRFDDARATLYKVRRADDPKVRGAVNRRVLSLLNRWLRLEQRAVGF